MDEKAEYTPWSFPWLSDKVHQIILFADANGWEIKDQGIGTQGRRVATITLQLKQELTVPARPGPDWGESEHHGPPISCTVNPVGTAAIKDSGAVTTVTHILDNATPTE